MGGRIGQSGCWCTRGSRQVNALVNSGGRSFLQQLFQAIQVALNEIGIGVVVFVCDAWLAKECEKQFAAASIGDQSHRDIDLRSRRSNDRVIQNTILVSCGEAYLQYAAIGVSNPSAVGPPERLAEAECPFIPIGGIDQEFINPGEGWVNANAESPRLDGGLTL